MTDQHHPDQPPWQSGPQNQPPWWNEPQQSTGQYQQPSPGQFPPGGQSEQPPGGPQYPPPQPYPGPPPGGRARQPRQSHRVRTVLLSIIGVLVVVIAIGVAVSGGKSPGKPASAGTTSPAAPAAQATGSGLTAAQQQFVSDMRAGTVFNVDSSVTDQQIAQFGQTVCGIRQSDQAQSSAISTAESTWSDTSAMQGDQVVRLAEKDICPTYLPPETVTYVVRGTSGAQVTYGPSGSDFNGNVPMHVTRPLGNPQFYAINAQLQGGGTVTCVIKVDGVTLSRATATGGFNIADCEISQDPITNMWEDTNTG
jgi:hypothetical protein